MLMSQIIRLLPFASADGPHNMAADEVMLDSAVGGVASMRFYRWSAPTLSLGYFQRAADRTADDRHSRLQWVRRATGGGAIVHDGDLTYALALPRQWARQHSPADWHCHIHKSFAQLLRDRQIAAEMTGGCRGSTTTLPFDCFALPQPGDVVVATRKIIGGAQRLRAGSLLQHGSLQGPAAELAPDLLAVDLASALGWRPSEKEWSAEEWNRIRHLAVYKYGQDSWNLKR
jgi:lipoate-protein ligase A